MCDGPGGGSLYHAIRFFFTPEDHARLTYPASEGLDDVIYQSLFVNNRQRQLLDHTYSLSRDQAFDYMTEFNKRLSDKVGIECTMDILLPTDDDNANIIIEYNGIIKKLMREAEKLELDTDAIKAMMRDLLGELKDDIDLNILIFDVTQLLIKYNLFRLDAITEQEFKNSFVRMDSRNMEIKKLTLSDIKKVVEMIEDRYSYALYITEEYG